MWDEARDAFLKRGQAAKTGRAHAEAAAHSLIRRRRQVARMIHDSTDKSRRLGY